MSENNNLEKDNVYIPLSPIDNAEKVETYMKALEWALNNEKIRNIALTGPYGSGKSSIIQTYQKKHPEENDKYLNISLATFNSKTGNNNQFEQNEIERSLLQQLFYRVSAEKIPCSRFHKICHIEKTTVLKMVIVLAIVIVLATFLFKPGIIDSFILDIIKINSLIYTTSIILGVVAFVVVSIMICSSLLYFIKTKFIIKGLSIPSAKMELTANNDSSMFNKYLDEIIYFFEETDYSIIFIEDLDRFNSTNIFTKLRELNTLINDNDRIDRKIIFIYAVKDDMFQKGERTKFFDFILPVIPVIDASNSAEKFIEIKKNNALWKSIDEEYLHEVSIFIDDMRIVNCIRNEFSVYQNILNDSSLKPIKMLSLIILKNLYPADFASLSENKGKLWSAFNYITTSKRDIISKINTEIENISNNIKELRSETLLSKKELKAVLLAEWANNIFDIKNIIIGNRTRYDISSFMDDQFDVNLLNGTSISIERYSNPQASVQVDKKYLDRFANLDGNSEIKIESLNAKKEKLQEQIRAISSLKLQEMLIKYSVNVVLPSDVAQEPLMVFMLRSGYIDETYPNYMTYFYPNSITAQDRNYILGVIDGKNNEFNYQLSKCKQIVTKLNEYEFSKQAILNFYIVDYLLCEQGDEKHQKSLANILKQLSNESEYSFNFLEGYRLRGENWDKLLTKVCMNWVDFWIYISNKSDLSNKTTRQYLVDIIKYVPMEVIVSMNRETKITSFISEYPEFLQDVSECDHTKIKKLLELLQVQFINMKVDKVEEDLLKFVFDNNLYVLNSDMITIVVNQKMPNKQKTVNISFNSIIETHYPNIIKYVENKFEEYLRNVFLNNVSDSEETSSSMLRLLNIKINDVSLLKQAIAKQEFVIDSIDKIPESLWVDIFEYARVFPKWLNAITYYNKCKAIDKSLIEYLNIPSIYDVLKHEQIVRVEEIEQEVFVLALIESGIEDTTFEFLADSIPSEYHIKNIEGISEKRLGILIEHNSIDFSPAVYEAIKTQFDRDKKLHIRLLEKNKQDFINNLNIYAIDDKDLVFLLESDEFDDNEKYVIASNGSAPLNEEAALIAIYKIYIHLKKDYDIKANLFIKIWGSITTEEQMQMFAKSFDYCDDKKLIISQCLKDEKSIREFFSSDIISHPIKKETLNLYDFNLGNEEFFKTICKFILSNGDVKLSEVLFNLIWSVEKNENRIELLANQINLGKFDVARMSRYLNELGGKFAKLLVHDGTHEKIKYTKSAEIVIEHLKKLAMISSYQREEDVIRCRKKKA